jgi:hypothetical protein
MEILNSLLGGIFYTVLVFAAGACIGKPLYTWVVAKLPWTRG